MKMRLWCCVLGILFLAFGSAYAETFSFGDSNHNWAGWDNASYGDTVGTPDILGGTGEVSATGYLTDLDVTMGANGHANLWSELRPADLFIDTDANGSWNYYVDIIDANLDWSASSPYDLYSIDHSIAGTGYTLSNMGPGFLYREGHPVSLDGEGSDVGDVLFSWPTASPYEATFDFTDGDIFLGSQFTIGWTVQCANDVLFETITNSSPDPRPVPEPGTMLLLGTGLIGFSGMARRKMRKASGRTQ